jgi:hypothetical protein
LKVSEKWVLREIFETKRDEAASGRKKLLSEMLHN